jgi:hypothetical protein
MSIEFLSRTESGEAVRAAGGKVTASVTLRRWASEEATLSRRL